MATTLQLQAAALAMLLSLLAPASAQQQQPPRPRPENCRDRCGNITVPYPFGIGAGCYRDGLEVVCDKTRSPPLLRIPSLYLEIDGLSVATGEARLHTNASRSCHNATWGSTSANSTFAPIPLGSGSAYRFSASRNRLVALGCPNLSYFVNGQAEYASGCVSVCTLSGRDDAQHEQECTGVGCCQVRIPPDIYHFEPYLYRDFAHQQGLNARGTACRYVFLADAEWWSGQGYNVRAYLSRTDDFAVPVVLDWAVRNVANCSAAVSNETADYACRSTNSFCVDSTNGPGYRCQCFDGYEGNPYVEGGCTGRVFRFHFLFLMLQMSILLSSKTEDIDECNPNYKLPCYGICTNTPGSYICECPPGTNGNASMPNSCRPKDKFTPALKVVAGVSVGVFLLAFMCFWLYLGIQKRKLIKTKQRFFEENGGVLLQQQMRSYAGAGAGSGGFKLFSEEELKKATDNFAADRVLGRGGHGIVYRGVLEDKSTVVAIKKSKVMEAAQTKEFAKEMFILSQINHRNVVKLLGCCLEVEVPMLVYEFVSNGTLYNYIHRKKEDLDADISFDTRLRIAAESAEALAYMHSSASPPIIHGDVKTANILLDDKLTAKVSDFGASKLAPTDEVEIATLVQGTCGYLDPEYLMTCQLTDKSDVYSFGVVLLELLTRKKALYFEGPEEDRSLVSCFTTAAKAARHGELLDSQVRSEVRGEVLDEIAHLVLQCVSMTSEERPTMKAVGERLEMLRRYQQHPWAQADDEDLERQGLLSIVQQDNLPYKFDSY
ncbi:hypothetical protein EJB05_42993, partial [Eragrostis curvula]